MSVGKAYLLDTNIFIQAKNSYYAFAICPGFWTSLLGMHSKERIFSIDLVRQELLIGRDDLADWTKQLLPGTFFHESGDVEVIESYGDIIEWVQTNPQFMDLAKADFASSADGWLVAYARVRGYVVVTQEEHAPDVRRKVPIPNVCRQFDVPYCDTFQMLKALAVQFEWKVRT